MQRLPVKVPQKSIDHCSLFHIVHYQVCIPPPSACLSHNTTLDDLHYSELWVVFTCLIPPLSTQASNVYCVLLLPIVFPILTCIFFLHFSARGPLLVKQDFCWNSLPSCRGESLRGSGWSLKKQLPQESCAVLGQHAGMVGNLHLHRFQELLSCVTNTATKPLRRTKPEAVEQQESPVPVQNDTAALVARSNAMGDASKHREACRALPKPNGCLCFPNLLYSESQ